jgi:hypothetical protein
MFRFRMPLRAGIGAALFGFTLACLSTLAIVKGNAQGFQWVYPFAGAQPQASIDFSNPPLTLAPQGGAVGATNAVENVPIGSVAYTSFGNATTYAASGDLYCTSIFVPYDMTVTNINVLNGGTVGTNSILAALYNAAGTLIGNSATAGATTSGANAFQALALTAAKSIQGPGVYYVCIQPNGTTDNVRTIAASTFVGRRASLITGGTFGTVPATITVPASFTANDGPIVYLN